MEGGEVLWQLSGREGRRDTSAGCRWRSLGREIAGIVLGWCGDVALQVVTRLLARNSNRDGRGS